MICSCERLIGSATPREQISPPSPRRFAPAEAPKFFSSIQLALEATSGSPITTTRSPITSKFAVSADPRGTVGGIDAHTQVVPTKLQFAAI